MAAKSDDFWAIAVSDYNASAENELDLREGHNYSVIDTPDGGWWYALDEDGIDGWAPATYLEKVSPQKNIQLQREHEEKMKQEEEKRRGTEITYHNFDDNESTTMEHMDMNNDALKNELLAKVNSFAKRMKERQRLTVASQQHFKQTDDQKSPPSQPQNQNQNQPQPQSQENNPFGNRYKTNVQPTSPKDNLMKQVNPRSNYMWNTSEKKQQTADKFAYQKRLQQDKTNKIRKRLFYDELSSEEKNIDDEYRPQLKSIVINKNINLGSYANKQFIGWSIDEILHFLVVNAKSSQNTFQLSSVLAVLAQKCKENLGTKKYALKNNALNILLYVLCCGGDKNVATSNSVCRAITTLCEGNATNLVLQYPCEKQGVFYICTAVRNSFRNPIFCCHALNCVVNFVKKNPTHRQYIITDAHNQKLILLIMEALELYRYAANHTKLIHCQKVQIAGCLALQNICAHPLGQKLVGPAGVEVILDTFVAFIDDDAVVVSALSALLNLCVSNSNAKAFLECEGLTFMNTFLDNECTPSSCRLLVCKIIHNMCCDPFLSRSLIDEYTEQCECVVMRLIAYAEYGTDLYLHILRFLKTLLQEINKMKLEFMKDLLEQNFVQMLIDALEYDYAIERNERANNYNSKYKKLIMNIYDHIIILLNQYYATNDEMCVAFIIDEEENDTHSWIPGILISMARCFGKYHAHMVWEIFKLFDNLSNNNTAMQKRLIEAGIVDVLLTTDWYTQKVMDPGAIRLGANILLKLLQSHPYHKAIWKVANDVANIRKFVQFMSANNPNYGSICKNIERQLKYIG